MRFEDERYVRLYTRDSTTWLMLPWQGKVTLPLVLRKVDRAGLIDLGAEGIEGLAAHLQIPLEIVETGLDALLKKGVLLMREDGVLVWPKFIEAQESKQSDKARQKARRDLARDRAAARARGVDVGKEPEQPGPDEPPDPERSVTGRNEESRTVTSRPPAEQNVTRSHTTSRGVTLCCAVPSRSVLNPLPPGVRDGEQPDGDSERSSTLMTPVPPSGPRYTRFEDPFWREAYTAAVIASVGGRWGFPDKQTSALRKAVEAHCTTPADANGWLSGVVPKFVAIAKQRPEMWSSFGPDGFLRWLNAQGPQAESVGASERARRSLDDYVP